MKAGIYETPSGNLVYVAKDRSIKATTLRPSAWPGMKVSHRSKDDTVEFLGYRCTRVADVPNGCTDHQAAVDAVQAARAAPSPVEALCGADPVQQASPDEDFAAWALQGWRLCGKQSARKHRKQGHEVRWIPWFGRAWR